MTCPRATYPPPVQAPRPQQPQPVPSTGMGHQLITVDSPGIVTVIIVLVFLLFGYILVLGIMAAIAYPDELNGIIMVGIALGFLLPIILFSRNKGGVYENGVRVRRFTFHRLMGKKSFFRWEDVHAFFPAEYETSAGVMMQPHTSHYHSYSRYPSAGGFGTAAGAMIADPGSRTGLGIMTGDGLFTLAPSTPANMRTPGYDMMGLVRYYMNYKGLPMVKVPYKASNDELSKLTWDSRPLSIKWYLIAVLLSLGLPFIVMGVALGIMAALGMGRSYEAVGAILVTIVISTALFAGYYQYGSTKRINATNKLNYYNASQPYLPYSDPAMNIDVNEINPLADGESGGYQVWDPSQGNSGERI